MWFIESETSTNPKLVNTVQCSSLSFTTQILCFVFYQQKFYMDLQKDVISASRQVSIVIYQSCVTTLLWLCPSSYCNVDLRSYGVTNVHVMYKVWDDLIDMSFLGVVHMCNKILHTLVCFVFFYAEWDCGLYNNGW